MKPFLFFCLPVLLATGFSFHCTAQTRKDTTSFIHTVDIYSGEIDTVFRTARHFEAPNWHRDGYLILNSYGILYTLDLATNRLKQLNIDFANKNNNDHGISPDGKWLAISHLVAKDSSSRSYRSAIYIVPVTGGIPRRITAEVPSYWHGWSPDGRHLVYCAERNGNYDVYRIPAEGGKEVRLTDAEGLDDGPEYSPDGKYIYFNSYRTGHMQIWRMEADGNRQEQMTFDKYSNWFPHPSPDGKWIIYLAYTTDEKANHFFGRQVKLRLMNLDTRDIRDITPVFFGGQGTINVPSWNADSRKLAFVSYRVE